MPVVWLATSNVNTVLSRNPVPKISLDLISCDFVRISQVLELQRERANSKDWFNITERFRVQLMDRQSTGREEGGRTTWRHKQGSWREMPICQRHHRLRRYSWLWSNDDTAVGHLRLLSATGEWLSEVHTPAVFHRATCWTLDVV